MMPSEARGEAQASRRLLLHAALWTGVGPLTDHHDGVAFADQTLDLEADVGGAGDRLLAEQDKGLAPQHRLRNAGRSMDHVTMKPARKSIPVARLEGVERRGHHLRRSHNQWNR